jgi:RNA polymerase sigma factor (sigma-70 family)
MKCLSPRRLPDDRHPLVTRNLGFARTLGRKVARDRLSDDDVLGAVSLAMVEAAGQCEDGRADHFLTYASFFVKKHVFATIRAANTIRVPSAFYLRHSPWLAAKPEAERAARRAVAAKAMRLVSLDAANPATGQSYGAELASPVADEGGDRDERSRAIRRRLELLSARDRAVIEARYGFDGNDGQTYAAIGAGLGMSRQGVQAVERRVLGSLREMFGVAGEHERSERPS